MDNELQIFYFFLAAWAILYGVNVFISERVIVVLSGLAALVTGVLALFLAF